MKSFNDLWIKSNSFCHLREQSNESPFPRCPVTGSWQLFPPHLDTIHHLSKRGIVAHQIKPCHWSSIPLDVFCVSTRDVSTSHFASWYCITQSSRRSILVEFLSVVIAWMKISKARMSRSTYATNQQPYEVQPGSWRLCQLVFPPSPYPTLESRDEILV